MQTNSGRQPASDPLNAASNRLEAAMNRLTAVLNGRGTPGAASERRTSPGTAAVAAPRIALRFTQAEAARTPAATG